MATREYDCSVCGRHVLERSIGELSMTTLCSLCERSNEPITEPTPQGNQYVIPGCEKDQTRGPAQMALF